MSFKEGGCGVYKGRGTASKGVDGFFRGGVGTSKETIN